eukprot:12400887-Karenia_brevis.AAC.1
MMMMMQEIQDGRPPPGFASAQVCRARAQRVAGQAGQPPHVDDDDDGDGDDDDDDGDDDDDDDDDDDEQKHDDDDDDDDE